MKEKKLDVQGTNERRIVSTRLLLMIRVRKILLLLLHLLLPFEREARERRKRETKKYTVEQNWREAVSLNAVSMMIKLGEESGEGW